MGLSEAAVQTEVRIEASQKGARLWRNNNGACQDQNGRMIRYGLGNDSAQINAQIKSSDLIGITPVVVTPGMVGQVVGVFTSYEIKPEGWAYRGTTRERAQAKWMEIITGAGGIAKFINGLGQV